MTEPTDKPLLDEQQLDEYLKGESSVSRQYRQLPSDEIPASLDRVVLQQAEDAVKRPSRPAWVHWTAPLAVAASAVLVVSIVMQTGLRDETTVAAPPTMAQKRAAEAEVETRMIQESAGAPAQEESADLAASMEADPAPSLPKLEVPLLPNVADEPQTFAVSPAPAPAPAAAPPPVSAPAPQMEAVEVQGSERAKAEQEDKAEFVADASRQKSAREELSRAQDRAVAQRATRNEQDQAAGAANAAPATVLSYSRPISASATDNVAKIQHTDPAAWLKEIRQLRKDNKQEEANREWRQFREAFPDYDVAETDAAREAKK
jgi:hypothetical protein